MWYKYKNLHWSMQLTAYSFSAARIQHAMQTKPWCKQFLDSDVPTLVDDQPPFSAYKSSAGTDCVAVIYRRKSHIASQWKCNGGTCNQKLKNRLLYILNVLVFSSHSLQGKPRCRRGEFFSGIRKLLEAGWGGLPDKKTQQCRLLANNPDLPFHPSVESFW